MDSLFLFSLIAVVWATAAIWLVTWASARLNMSFDPREDGIFIVIVTCAVTCIAILLRVL